MIQLSENLRLVCKIYHLGGQPTVINVMLFGAIDIFFARLNSLLLIQYCTMIERVDTTRPAVVSSKQSEAVKE